MANNRDDWCDLVDQNLWGSSWDVNFSAFGSDDQICYFFSSELQFIDLFFFVQVYNTNLALTDYCIQQSSCFINHELCDCSLMQPEFVMVKDHKFLWVDLILQLPFHYCLLHQCAFDTFLFFRRIMNCVLWAVIKNFLDSFKNGQMPFL